jgi:L-threonylcarbamoyladenylate synthase
MILRQGAITKEEIEDVLKIPVESKTESTLHALKTIIVPGSDEVHYAPEKPLYLLEKEELQKFILTLSEKKESFSVLSFEENEKDNEYINKSIFWIVASKDPIRYAQELYSNLRELDKKSTSCILVEMPPKSSQWLAIKDRLQRARTVLPE